MSYQSEVRYDVFDPDGEFLYEASFPTRTVWDVAWECARLFDRKHAGFNYYFFPTVLSLHEYLLWCLMEKLIPYHYLDVVHQSSRQHPFHVKIKPTMPNPTTPAFLLPFLESAFRDIFVLQPKLEYFTMEEMSTGAILLNKPPMYNMMWEELFTLLFISCDLTVNLYIHRAKYTEFLSLLDRYTNAPIHHAESFRKPLQDLLCSVLFLDYSVDGVVSIIVDFLCK